MTSEYKALTICVCTVALFITVAVLAGLYHSAYVTRYGVKRTTVDGRVCIIHKQKPFCEYVPR